MRNPATAIARALQIGYVRQLVDTITLLPVRPYLGAGEATAWEVRSNRGPESGRFWGMVGISSRGNWPHEPVTTVWIRKDAARVGAAMPWQGASNTRDNAIWTLVYEQVFPPTAPTAPTLPRPW
jgi:hypothetical protein